jgi:hypothetical protein
MRLSPCITHQIISGRSWTRAYFRDGSSSTELGCLRHVRFWPDSGRRANVPVRQLRAICRLKRRSKYDALFDHLVGAEQNGCRQRQT